MTATAKGDERAKGFVPLDALERIATDTPRRAASGDERPWPAEVADGRRNASLVLALAATVSAGGTARCLMPDQHLAALLGIRGGARSVARTVGLLRHLELITDDHEDQAGDDHRSDAFRVATRQQIAGTDTTDDDDDDDGESVVAGAAAMLTPTVVVVAAAAGRTHKRAGASSTVAMLAAITATADLRGGTTGRASRAVLAAKVGITETAAKHALSALVGCGLVVRHGAARRRSWSVHLPTTATVQAALDHAATRVGTDAVEAAAGYLAAKARWDGPTGVTPRDTNVIPFERAEKSTQSDREEHPIQPSSAPKVTEKSTPLNEHNEDHEDHEKPFADSVDDRSPRPSLSVRSEPTAHTQLSTIEAWLEDHGGCGGCDACAATRASLAHAQGRGA